MSTKEKEFILGILDLPESQPPDTDLKNCGALAHIYAAVNFLTLKKAKSKQSL